MPSLVNPEQPTDMHRRVDALIAEEGGASVVDLGVPPEAVLEFARTRPDLEPVFLTRFRSQSGKVRIELIRAYAWPSRRIALRHLGYRAVEARLVRLEPRQAVPFPERFYAAFDAAPERLEELRLAERAYEEAMRRASSSPGRTERDLVRLARAFRRFGEAVEIEMWIDAAAILSDLDHPVFAAKMLDHLRKIVEKNRKVDPSMLARTVLSAADAGVFHGKLYEIARDKVALCHSPEAAAGFGLRVLRRLLCSGRALPADFMKDLVFAAERGKVKDFDALVDGTIRWAAGLPSFWNALKKRPSGREERAADPPDLVILRRRLAEILKAASPAEKADLRSAMEAAAPELSSYGRVAVVETLLAMPPQGHEDGEHLLAATVSLLGRAPREADRERLELALGTALRHLIDAFPDLLRQRTALLDGALRSASFDLTLFVALSDLFADATERAGQPFALPGLPLAWAAAVAKALSHEKSKELPETPADSQGSEAAEPGLSPRMPMLAIVAEAFSLLSPECAAEPLAALGPKVAALLANDVYRGVRLSAWERVLDSLRRLGPPGLLVTAAATARFLKLAGGEAALNNSDPFAHLAPKSVPPRVPGIARAELRRAVRSAFHDPLASLVFWSLEGDTPEPVLESLTVSDKPAAERAWMTGIRLLGLAQRVRYGQELAVRALKLAEAIAGAIHEDVSSVESLRRGIELTRMHIDRREVLRPEAWPAPAIPGVDDPRHRRFVLLAWLLGRLDTRDVGTNHLVFERIARMTGLVRSGYGRLLPARGEGQGQTRFSAAFADLSRSAFIRVPIDGDELLDDMIVLRDPIEIVRAFVAEAGTASLPP